jgi:hypothetical protein
MLMNPTDSTTDPAGDKALTDPTFIIEHDGALYVTEGVLEYRWSEDLSDEQRRGVEEIRRLYDEARRSAGGSAQTRDSAQFSGESYPQGCPVVDRMGVVAFMATKPPRPPGG